MRTSYRGSVIKLLVGLLILGAPNFAFCDTMSSTSFIIQSDDMTVGGGRSVSVLTTYRFSITPTSSSSNFYYDLSGAPADFWTQVRSDGGDIRVTAQDGTTPANRRILGWDYADKTGALFIEKGSATSFYVYYGNHADTEPAAVSITGCTDWENGLEGWTGITMNPPVLVIQLQPCPAPRYKACCTEQAAATSLPRLAINSL